MGTHSSLVDLAGKAKIDRHRAGVELLREGNPHNIDPIDQGRYIAVAPAFSIVTRVATLVCPVSIGSADFFRRAAPAVVPFGS